LVDDYVDFVGIGFDGVLGVGEFDVLVGLIVGECCCDGGDVDFVVV